jgi:hypothetical protein
MILFFRKLRQRFLAQSQVTRYLAYAVGEIVLVMVGILLALQVNNWNEDRQKRMRFEFGLKQLYARILSDYLQTPGLEDEVRYQLALIDTLITHPESLKPERIPAMLQVLDELAPRSNSDEELFLPYLDFNPTDSLQATIAQNLRRYYSNQRYFDDGAVRLGLNGVLKNHLRKRHIPLRHIGQGTSYRAFIDGAGDGFYSEENLRQARELIRSEAFLADLRTLGEWRKELVVHIDVIQTSNRQFLDYLRSHFSELPEFVEYIELVGSATPSRGWAVGYPMRAHSDRHVVWDIEIELTDGLIKFRSDSNWTLDWGRGELNPDKLVLKGADIPVKAGKYRITIDLEQNTYQIEPVSANHE